MTCTVVGVDPLPVRSLPTPLPRSQSETWEALSHDDGAGLAELATPVKCTQTSAGRGALRCGGWRRCTVRWILLESKSSRSSTHTKDNSTSKATAARPPGVLVRVLQRMLALTTAIWHNDHIGQPIKRSLLGANEG